MADLFDAAGLGPPPPPAVAPVPYDAPLAERLRPTTLSEVAGQDQLLAPDAPIGRMAASGRLASMILWGPPGVGKTTIARLLAHSVNYQFEQISAVFSGVADLKKLFDAAKRRREAGKATLLFVDEIHRFNRAQQDGFLPFVESGIVTLVGATTENPSFELNGALLSRCQVFVLRRLDGAAMETLLKRAEAHEGRELPLTAEAREVLGAMADGDGRYVLTLAEALFALPSVTPPLDPAALAAALQRRRPAYDKDREEHYNLISALHKSIRGSDPDAALYWLARMLDGGEEPLFVARRLVRAAIEDIGAADPMALVVATAAKDAYDFLGSPEGELALAQVVVHLATAPKSNAVYAGYSAAKAAAKAGGSLMPPKHILSGATKLMKSLGYGKGYAYDPATETGFSAQNYWPDEMEPQVFYTPRGEGAEAAIKERLDRWNALRAAAAAE
ncbi:replication-associated recombination protein A [soil metagenome]